VRSIVENLKLNDILFSIVVFASLIISFVYEFHFFILGITSLSIVLLTLQYFDFKFEDEVLLGIILFLIFIGPLIKIFPSAPMFRPEQFLVFSIFPLFLIFRDLNPTSQVRFFLKWFIFFQLIQTISLFYGYFILDVNIGVKDFIEIFRVFSYGLTIYVVSTMSFQKASVQTIIYIILYLFIASSLIGLFQYYGVLGFDRITAPLYFPGRIHDVHDRMMGTFVNPNTYGSFVSIGSIISLGLFLNEERRKIKFYTLIAFFLLTATLLLTVSRTALVSYLAGLSALILLFGISKGLKWYKILFTLLGISTGLLFIGLLLAGDIWSRLKTILNFMEDLSWQMRLFAWYINLQLFLESPLIGWGPTFHQFTSTVDSDYILILRRYGIIGFLVYISFYLLPLYYAIINLKRKKFSGVLNQIFIAASIALITGNIANSLFHEMQFMSFWSVFVGLVFINNK